MKKLLVLMIVCHFTFNLYAQTISDSLLLKPWDAQWITAPFEGINTWNVATYPAAHAYGVYKFRKAFELTAVPAKFIVHVSGDNRYKLFVNEKLVSLGPARGDLYFWNFETVDIAPYLAKGKNIVAALVWNDGIYKPEAQITYATAFILQGNSPVEAVLNTNETWKAVEDSSYAPIQPHVPGYYVAGPGEQINMQQNIEGWNKKDYSDVTWQNAATLGKGLTKDASRDARGWMLVPSTLQQRELTTQRFASVRMAENVSVPASFPAASTTMTIPANTKATLLLDQSYLTNAYPTMLFSKGADATISIAYAEALYKRDTVIANNKQSVELSKGDRNVVEGKIFIGKKDSIISNGKDEQEFTSLWWRTFRYVQISIETKDQPLQIEDIYSTFTGYPFQYATTFTSTDTVDQQILNIGWRTARLCAFETYMDCPYYEQLQYIGDARIQALVTMYNTGNDEFVKNALTLMDHSRLAEGITQSRYPTDLDQQIPTFSLWWIGMLHDYWMYRRDSTFIKNKLPGARQVLNFFAQYQQSDGSLKNVPYWLFTDWVDYNGWDYGQAPISNKGYSALLDIQLMWIYKQAAEMESHLGFKDIATFYNTKAAQLQKTIQQRYWDASKKMYADTDAKDLYSQHTNALAILSGQIKGSDATDLAKRILADTSLAQASIYFKYYLHQACIKAGLGDEYMQWLGKWKENIKLGLTTWAEMSDVSRSRSDCHAWGSSPNIEFYRTVLGIDSDAPGFTKIKIEPHLGTLQNASGSMPHPNGLIKTSYVQTNGKWNVQIALPTSTSGTFVFKGKTYALKSGANSFVL